MSLSCSSAVSSVSSVSSFCSPVFSDSADCYGTAASTGISRLFISSADAQIPLPANRKTAIVRISSMLCFCPNGFILHSPLLSQFRFEYLISFCIILSVFPEPVKDDIRLLSLQMSADHHIMILPVPDNSVIMKHIFRRCGSR